MSIEDSRHAEGNLYPTRKIVRLGFLLGIVLSLLVICIDVAGYLSRSQAFDRIELSAPEAQTLDALRTTGIYCDDAWISYRCTFDDYWRVYRITFSDSQPNHPVVRKTRAYKGYSDHSFILRSMRFLRIL